MLPVRSSSFNYTEMNLYFWKKVTEVQVKIHDLWIIPSSKKQTLVDSSFFPRFHLVPVQDLALIWILTSPPQRPGGFTGRFLLLQRPLVFPSSAKQVQNHKNLILCPLTLHPLTHCACVCVSVCKCVDFFRVARTRVIGQHDLAVGKYSNHRSRFFDEIAKFVNRRMDSSRYFKSNPIKCLWMNRKRSQIGSFGHWMKEANPLKC